MINLLDHGVHTESGGGLLMALIFAGVGFGLAVLGYQLISRKFLE